MALITLTIPNEKLSLFGELLHALGIADTNDDFPIQEVNANSIVDTSNIFFKKYFDWEDYQNELEFE